MNYGPYMGFPYGMMPTATRSGGLFSKLLGGINFSSILTNTQKTLGIVNQAIPVIRQVQPVLKNAKTMFKVMNEFKRPDNTVTNIEPVRNDNSIEKTIEENNTIDTISGGPTFFM